MSGQKKDAEENFEEFINKYWQEGENLLNEKLTDNIKESHIFMVFQIEEDNMTQIHICKDIQEVKQRRDAYAREKYFRGERLCQGGDFVGRGNFSYIPLFPDSANPT